MITRIASLPVYVRDQDRALEFYTQALGFEKRADVPMGPGARWVSVAPEGSQTEIALTTPAMMNPQHGLNFEALTGRFTGIVFHTPDIAAVHRDLSARGVRFTEPPSAQPWGTYANFVDPDGNSFVLVQPAG